MFSTHMSSHLQEKACFYNVLESVGWKTIRAGVVGSGGPKGWGGSPAHSEPPSALSRTHPSP